MASFHPRPAFEAGIFAALRVNSTEIAKWAAARMGRSLFELPVVKTAYIPFGVAIVALLWVKLSGEKWSDYGLKPIRSIWRVIGAGLLLTAIYLAYAVLLQPQVDALVSETLGGSKTDAAKAFAAVVGNLNLYLFALPFIWIFAAFGEEFFYRGFLMTKLARAFGGGRGALIAAAIVQAVIFGLAHSYQGPVGMVGTGLVGLLYGFATLAAGRSLWPAVIAHGLVDTLAFTLLYLGMMETG